MTTPLLITAQRILEQQMIDLGNRPTPRPRYPDFVPPDRSKSAQPQTQPQTQPQPQQKSSAGQNSTGQTFKQTGHISQTFAIPAKHDRPKATPPKEKPPSNVIDFEAYRRAEIIEKVDSLLPTNKLILAIYGIWSGIVACFVYLIFPLYIFGIFTDLPRYRSQFIKEKEKTEQDEIDKLFKKKKSPRFLKENETYRPRFYLYAFLLAVWFLIGPLVILKQVLNLVLHSLGT